MYKDATECVEDLDKLNRVKLGYGGSVLGLSQKIMLALKVVKGDLKIIVLLRQSKSVTHFIELPL